MPPRRQTPLQLTAQEPEDTVFECTGGPIFSGDGSLPDDLVCGRCHRTLFLALSVDGLFDLLAGVGRFTDPHGRRKPLLAQCDCGVLNRVWPPPVD